MEAHLLWKKRSVTALHIHARHDNSATSQVGNLWSAVALPASIPNRIYAPLQVATYALDLFMEQSTDQEKLQIE